MDVQYNGAVAIIDLRERISRGEHPREEILQFVSQAEPGSVIEIHLPHRAEPLAAALRSIGVGSVTNPLGDNHFRLMCVRM